MNRGEVFPEAGKKKQKREKALKLLPGLQSSLPGDLQGFRV